MLRSGADVNFPDVEGWPAVVAAAEEGHVLVLKVLLKHKGILVNLTCVRSPQLNTVRQKNESLLTSLTGHHHGVAPPLILCVAHRNRDNETALMRAVLGGHTEAAEELMQKP